MSNPRVWSEIHQAYIPLNVEDPKDATIAALRERLAEVEAERDEFRRKYNRLIDMRTEPGGYYTLECEHEALELKMAEAEARVKQIRAETIEECASVAYVEAVKHCSARDGKTLIGHPVGYSIKAALLALASETAGGGSE